MLCTGMIFLQEFFGLDGTSPTPVMPCLSPVSAAALTGRARGSVAGVTATKTRKRSTKAPKPIRNLAKESHKGSHMAGVNSKDPALRKPTLDERIRSLIETALH